jgi:hypothetical protein
MASVLDEIGARIRSLKPEEKTELLRSLVAELDGPPDPDADAEWTETAGRRHQEILQKKVRTIPGNEVFRKARSRLKG